MKRSGIAVSSAGVPRDQKGTLLMVKREPSGGGAAAAGGRPDGGSAGGVAAGAAAGAGGAGAYLQSIGAGGTTTRAAAVAKRPASALEAVAAAAAAAAEGGPPPAKLTRSSLGAGSSRGFASAAASGLVDLSTPIPPMVGPPGGEPAVPPPGPASHGVTQIVTYPQLNPPKRR